MLLQCCLKPNRPKYYVILLYYITIILRYYTIYIVYYLAVWQTFWTVPSYLDHIGFRARHHGW